MGDLMRVVGGNYRSRPLKAVPGMNTRPTTDKVKESMFNVLSPYLSSCHLCLDFYAGSGALAIEAVSRGVDQAVLCEQNHAAIKTIEANLLMTQELSKFHLLKGNNRQALKRWFNETSEVFDLVFLDPPYKKGRYLEDLRWLKKESMLADQAVILCESDQEHQWDSEVDDFEWVKSKKYGQSYLSLLIYRGDEVE